jgi:hypothetical protein
MDRIDMRCIGLHAAIGAACLEGSLPPRRGGAAVLRQPAAHP